MVGEAANALASSSEMFSSRPMQLILSGEFWVELCSIQTPNFDILYVLPSQDIDFPFWSSSFSIHALLVIIWHRFFTLWREIDTA